MECDRVALYLLEANQSFDPDVTGSASKGGWSPTVLCPVAGPITCNALHQGEWVNNRYHMPGRLLPDASIDMCSALDKLGQGNDVTFHSRDDTL